MRIKRATQLMHFLALAVLMGIGVNLLAMRSAATQSKTSEVMWSLAATGDSIFTRQVSMYDDPPFMDMVKIIREADVASTNLELSLFRLWEFKGYPQVEQGGNWELGPPEVAEDLKWMGFDLLSRANNHTTDYGVEGMIVTNQLLDSLGLVHAGSGMTAGEATQAKYFESKKGRFALISLATSFTTMSRAGEPRPEIKGRPGLNGLRVRRSYQLEPALMAEWRKIVKALGGRLPDSEKAPVRFGRITFVPGAESKVIAKVNARDEERILRSIRNAARQANFVIVNAHSHDAGGRDPLKPPPAYIQEFVKKCLDAGADTYIIHGPHRLMGIEIYKGKPIFYSLGNFFFQNETIEPMPDDMYENFGIGNESLAADLYDTRFKIDKTGRPTTGFPTSSIYYESVIAVPVFRGHKVVEIKLYPIDIGHKMPRPQRGTPRMADPALAKKIIDELAKMSEIFGTRIVFKDGIGIWESGAVETDNEN